jgi:hypothetical protein
MDHHLFSFPLSFFFLHVLSTRLVESILCIVSTLVYAVWPSNRSPRARAGFPLLILPYVMSLCGVPRSVTFFVTLLHFATVLMLWRVAYERRVAIAYRKEIDKASKRD